MKGGVRSKIWGCRPKCAPPKFRGGVWQHVAPPNLKREACGGVTCPWTPSPSQGVRRSRSEPCRPRCGGADPHGVFFLGGVGGLLPPPPVFLGERDPPNVALADEDASVVDGFGQSQLENLSLEAAFEEILDFQPQNVIQLHLPLVQHPDPHQPPQQRVSWGGGHDTGGSEW